MRRADSQRAVRYLVGGALCAILNNLILIAGSYLGFGYVGLAVAGYAITGTFGYVFQSLITFRRQLRWSSYSLFMSGSLLGLIASIAILYVLCTLLSLPMWIAAPLLTGVMLIYNYISAKFSTMRRIID